MLHIRLFGSGQATLYDQPLTGFPYQQAYLLLCYLLLNRSRPHNRERLAAVFWGDYSTDASRKNLRNVLWRLRHAFQSLGAIADEYVSINEESASFSATNRYWLDVEAFETTVTRCRDVSGQDLTPEQATALEQAVELYTGDLLEGIYDDWCLHDRERLGLLHLGALGKLMAFHEKNGTYERGLLYGQRILERDDTRDKVHRDMMRLYWLMGDRSAALEQYKRCEQIMRETLGIAPTEATQRLYQKIVHQQSDRISPLLDGRTWHPVQATSGEPSQLSAIHLHDRLQRLHRMLDEVSLELNQIEQIAGNGVFHSGQPYANKIDTSRSTKDDKS